MNLSTLSRRHFRTTLGAAVAGIDTAAVHGAPPDNIRLGMMLQGSSAAELHHKAKAIAGGGFDAVQLTFFFQPTADEVQSLARTLKEFKLKTDDEDQSTGGEAT